MVPLLPLFSSYPQNLPYSFPNPPMRILFFLLALLLFCSTTTATDDKSAMEDLLKSFSIPPSSWSSKSDYCTWNGVRCDSNNRVTSINLTSKSLSATLPPSLNSLSQLTSLSLENNQFSGALPSLSNLSSLQQVYLDSNNFTSIPAGAFGGLTSLQILSLSNNVYLSPWPFPSELSDSATLVSIYASNANIEGPITDVFGSFAGLQNLRLTHNSLNGSLPTSFNGSAIQNLWLDNQGLSGSIDVLAGMTKLSQVWLHSNNFTGPIPDLSACTEIFDLQLRDNQFSGIVPPSLVSLPKLSNITLRNNYLQGPIPNFPVIINVLLKGNRFCKNISGDCDPQVSTLLQVAGALGYPIKLAEAWQGNNACNQWVFVTCDSNRKVIILNFAKQGFSGTISPAFANLTSLTELYLSDNKLIGTIPESLATLPRLKKIDVTYNNLSGAIPSFKAGVSVLTSGNKNIGKDVNAPAGRGSSSSSSASIGMVVGVVIGVLVLFVVLMFASYMCYMRKKRHPIESRENAEQGESLSQLGIDLPVKFSYENMVSATHNFDMQKKLGAGGFGSVFEGSLRDGTKIAVKRLDNLGQGRKQFLAEVRTLGSIQHVNLVKLIGFCAENKNRLLVYEYMSNGSLDKWIFSSKPRGILSWDAKRKIILQIAKGLAYLHEECRKRIAHLDVKPQNVLLDDAFNAKLSDFGLAKLIDKDQSHVMTQMRGTRGYLAPEWLGRKITEKVDVYGYGVVVLEIVFERKNLDCSQPEESTLLIHMVKQKVEESQFCDLLNECSEEMQQNFEDIEMIVKLALWCLHAEPARRPLMSVMMKVLEGAMTLEAISDYTIAILKPDENPTDEAITKLSASVLSGPR